MKLTARIDHIMSSLVDLKIRAAESSTEANLQFAEILETALEEQPQQNSIEISEQKNLTQIPDWVNPAFDYDPENPRKPNMREFLESLTGRSLEELYAGDPSSWQQISRTATELLYGVAGSAIDTRDWGKIMSSEDKISAARIETRKMHGTAIEIGYGRDENNQGFNKYVNINSADGTLLRSVPYESELLNEILANFGVAQSLIETYK